MNLIAFRSPRADSAGRRDIKLVTEIDTEDAEIEADSDLIVRVVENLPENAIRFSPPGGRVTLPRPPSISSARTKLG